MDKDLPMLKGQVLTATMTVVMEKELKSALVDLKSKGVDHQELMRIALRDAVRGAQRKLARV